MKKLICAMVLLSFLVTQGCTAMTQKQKATAQGAAGGALLGAGIGYLISKDGKGALVGGILGGMIGGAVSNQYATKLDNERKKLAGRENDLDARIQYARAMNEETSKYNDKLTAEIKALENHYRKGRVKKADLDKMHNELKKDVDKLSANLSELKAYQKSLDQKNQPRAKLDDLDLQIQNLQKQLASLQANAGRLASINQRINV